MRVSVQAAPQDSASWTSLARRLQVNGFDALLVADHPGSGAAPWTALGAAAAVTDSLGLGTYVLNMGVRDPLQVATEAATLNRLAPGRVYLGLGTGHTPDEWSQVGMERPSPAQRVERLDEATAAITGLLAGDTVTFVGRHLRLNRARLQDLPTDSTGAPPVRLTIGGGNRALLSLAAQRADVVALSGLGRTLPDGHRHEVRWTQQALRTQLDLVSERARTAGRSPALEALVQAVDVTDDRERAAALWADRLGIADLQQVLNTPFMLIGTHQQIAGQLRRQAKQWGITRYVVREQAVDDLATVLETLRAGSG